MVSSSRQTTAGARRALPIAETASTVTQIAQQMITMSMISNSQFCAVHSVRSCRTAAHSDIRVTNTSGMSTGQVGRRSWVSMTTRMARVRPAMSWLVVPNSGQMSMPPEPSTPVEKVRPSAQPTAMRVAARLESFTPASSAISATTRRCRRMPESMVVAANSTAMVARMVADREVGMPRPSFIRSPPPLIKASTPPAFHSE